MTANLVVAPKAIEQFKHFKVRRVAGKLGGEVSDIKLSADLSPEAFDELQDALVKYKVLFIRDQAHLDDKGHEAFGARFGKTVAHPTVPAPIGTNIFELNASKGGGRANSWHTDVTFVEKFPKIAILRAVDIPEYGGDTVWADTVAAYAELPAPLKELAEQLWAVHGNDYDYGATRTQIAEQDRKHHDEVFVSQVYEAEHPVVHVHPISGEKALLLGHFVKRFSGFSSTDTTRIFEALQSRVTRLENTVRWQWRKDDVAIWDNRSTQHYAINDYGSQHRLVRRVTIEGEAAVSVNGERSKTLSHPTGSNETREEPRAAAVGG